MNNEWDEILKKLNGFDLPDAISQADHIITQALDGVRISSQNCDQIRQYLVQHLQASEERGYKRCVIEAKFKNRHGDR